MKARGAKSALQRGPHIPLSLPLPRVHHRSPGRARHLSLHRVRAACSRLKTMSFRLGDIHGSMRCESTHNAESALPSKRRRKPNRREAKRMAYPACEAVEMAHMGSEETPAAVLAGQFFFLKTWNLVERRGEYFLDLIHIHVSKNTLGLITVFVEARGGPHTTIQKFSTSPASGIPIFFGASSREPFLLTPNSLSLENVFKCQSSSIGCPTKSLQAWWNLN